MSYACPYRSCDGFRTEDPVEMAAHSAAHDGPPPGDPLLRRRVSRIVGWMVVGAALSPFVGIDALIVLGELYGLGFD